jgi:hypothetical protein
MHQIEPRQSPKFIGGALIAIGLLLLLGQIFNLEFIRLNFGDIPWPLYQIVPGLILIAGGLVLGHKGLVLTILGTLAVVSGVILWYQTSTGAFQTWAYAWALVFPASVGLAMAIQGALTSEHALIGRGVNLMVIGLALFGIGFAFFEYVINLSGFSGGTLGRFVGPVLLIALGVYSLLRQRRGRQLNSIQVSSSEIKQ